MNEKDLRKKKNVLAVGRGKKIVDGVVTDRDAIVVGVVKKIKPRSKATAQLGFDNVVPQSVDGVETDVVEVGKLEALADHKEKWRPAPGGVSCGHFAITCGTLGMKVVKGGTPQILSNNHVLANSNDCEMHDPILQPGPYDGGTTADVIANLSSYVKLVFLGDESTCPFAKLLTWIANGFAKLFGRYTRFSHYSSAANKVDAAIARPMFDEHLSDEILEIGTPAGFNLGPLVVGQVVKKSGRTTGLNQGTIIMLDAWASVQYGDKIAQFEDQILTSPIAQGGDSGSVVLNESNQVIGLLFGGSDQSTVVNRIGNVIQALGLDY